MNKTERRILEELLQFEKAGRPYGEHYRTGKPLPGTATITLLVSRKLAIVKGSRAYITPAGREALKPEQINAAPQAQPQAKGAVLELKPQHLFLQQQRLF